MAPNLFLLAADNSPELLSLLRKDPTLASSQDDHGYSLVHAAASYNHLDLLRTLIRELKVNVDLKDEDNETALFVVETPDAAKLLIELDADPLQRSFEGLTAREKIETEGDFPSVVAYLSTIESERNMERTAAVAIPETIPHPPEGLEITMGTMDEVEDIPGQVNPEFRRRIEEFASRDDFNTPEGQADLRKLIEDAVADQGLGDERAVRSRQE